MVDAQFTGLKHLHAAMPTAVKLGDEEEVTEEVLRASLKRSLDWMSSLQADDGHWPGDFSGILYLMPFWVRDPTSPIHALFGQQSPTNRTFKKNERPGCLFVLPFPLCRFSRYTSLDRSMMPYQQSISVRYAVIFITIRHGTRLYH